MPSDSVIKAEFQIMWMQKVLIFKICSPAGFEPAISWIQVSCTTRWAMWLWCVIECCSSFLHFFVFKRLQNAIWSPHYLAVTNLMMGFMMLGSLYVVVDSFRRVIGVTDRQTDIFLAYIYRSANVFLRIVCRAMLFIMVTGYNCETFSMNAYEVL